MLARHLIFSLLAAFVLEALTCGVTTHNVIAHRALSYGKLNTNVSSDLLDVAARNQDGTPLL